MPDVNTVLDRVRERVETLGFTFEGQSVLVVKRKLPKRQPSDPRELITVSKSAKEEEVEKFTTHHNRFTYYIQVVLVIPSGDDQLTTLPDHARWREGVISLFKRKPPDLLGIDGLRDTRASPQQFLDRKLIAEGWDYQVVEVTLEIVEAA